VRKISRRASSVDTATIINSQRKRFKFVHGTFRSFAVLLWPNDMSVLC